MDVRRVINVELAGRKYPLSVKTNDESEEENIRNGVKYLNGKMIQYQQKYKDRDVFDYLVMSALDAATHMLKYRQSHSPDSLFDKLRNIDDKLSIFLSNEQ